MSYSFLFVDKCSDMFWVEDIARHLLQVLRRETINMSHDIAEIALLTLVQEVLGEVEGELLTTVAGNGQLTLQLLFGLQEL